MQLFIINKKNEEENNDIWNTKSENRTLALKIYCCDFSKVEIKTSLNDDNNKKHRKGCRSGK